MRKQSKGGNGNMLLLAGLGVGAFMLFANRNDAQGKSSSDLIVSGDETNEIPAAPKILAVNQSSTESPTPTGIVSDEEGMETTVPSEPTSSDEGESDGYENSNSSGPIVNRTTGSANTSSTRKRQSKGNNIPTLISTTLTAKEKSIINKGVLNDDLAIQRPDLYKAIYIRKHGRNSKSLQAADRAIHTIQINGNSSSTSAQKKARMMAITLNPNSQRMIMAAAQAAGGGMATMASLSTISAMQHNTSTSKAPVKTRPLQRKVSSKGAHPHRKAAHPSKNHPATKHPAIKHRTGSTPHKAVPLKKH